MFERRIYRKEDFILVYGFRAVGVKGDLRGVGGGDWGKYDRNIVCVCEVIKE